MSYLDIKPGKYITKATRGGFGKSGTGTAYVAIEFPIEQETIFWYGYLSPAAAPRTFETLATLGFREDLDVKDGQFGPEHLEDKQVEIVIELQPNPNKDNRLEPKVKWINNLGGGKFANSSVQEIFGSQNSLKSAMVAARARLKIPTPANKVEDDLPF